MKLHPLVSSLIALASLASPSVIFGAAADLNACCTPGDKDAPKSGFTLGTQSLSARNQVTRDNS